MSEKELQKQVLSFLQDDSRITAAWRNDVDKTRARKYGNSSHRPKGLPDICGMLRGGRFFCIELKFEKGKPSPEQVQFIAHIKANFGEAKIAWSLLEVQKWLNEIFPIS